MALTSLPANGVLVPNIGNVNAAQFALMQGGKHLYHYVAPPGPYTGHSGAARRNYQAALAKPHGYIEVGSSAKFFAMGGNAQFPTFQSWNAFYAQWDAQSNSSTLFHVLDSYVVPAVEIGVAGALLSGFASSIMTTPPPVIDTPGSGSAIFGTPESATGYQSITDQVIAGNVPGSAAGSLTDQAIQAGTGGLDLNVGTLTGTTVSSNVSDQLFGTVKGDLIKVGESKVAGSLLAKLAPGQAPTAQPVPNPSTPASGLNLVGLFLTLAAGAAFLL